MKCIDTLIVAAAMVLAVRAANSQMTVAPGDGGKTVIETVTTRCTAG
jgi:pentose-5-phosphate-3-epimerase